MTGKEKKPRMIVGATKPQNVLPVVEEVNKLMSRKVTFETTHHSDTNMVDIKALVSDEEYEELTQSGILIKILYGEEN